MPCLAFVAKLQTHRPFVGWLSLQLAKFSLSTANLGHKWQSLFDQAICHSAKF